jgi:hypothetical protein
MTTRLNTLAAVLAAFLMPVISVPATADDRPLIWEFSKQSDTSYSARAGSSLPRAPEASIGTEIRMRGPDPAAFDDPVSLWATLQLAERGDPVEGRSTRLNARMDGRSGRRSVSMDNSVAHRFGRLNAELRQHITVFQEPASSRKARMRTTQSVRLSSPATRTTVTVRASRTNDETWNTSLAVDQDLRRSVRVSASIDNPGRHSRAGRITARYRYSW